MRRRRCSVAGRRRLPLAARAVLRLAQAADRFVRGLLGGRARGAALAALMSASVRSDAIAQSRVVTEGASFLLIPIGAQAIGIGQATVADQPGTEAIWWNPAGLARAEKPEVAVHHWESLVASGDVVSLLVPSSLLGVFAASIYIVNYGEQDIPGPPGAGRVGTFTPLNLVYAATYGTPIGSRVSAGVTFKVVQFRISCNGLCGETSVISASTTAVDFGAQYDLTGILAPLTLGVAVRHLGPRLQVNDRAQADPLPTRIQLGAQYRVDNVSDALQDFDLQLSGDVVDRLDLETPAVRFGADISWRKRASIRGGYVWEASEAKGPSVGFGIVVRSLRLDLARRFESFSRGLAAPPTYISLRYLF